MLHHLFICMSLCWMSDVNKLAFNKFSSHLNKKKEKFKRCHKSREKLSEPWKLAFSLYHTVSDTRTIITLVSAEVQ